MQNTTMDGARVYNPLTLKLYDWWVLGVSNRFAWRCSTSQTLVHHFTKHLGTRHLDIGVGTGFYLAHAPADSHISLMDMNSSSLAVASRRAGARIVDTIRHDIFQPFPEHYHGAFDSISMFYLLHCLPGTMPEKSLAIRNAACGLKKNGTLYGATILGDSADHNALGRKLMRLYNHKGIFSNHNDNEDQLRQSLMEHFTKVKISRAGVVALFAASKPLG